MFAGFLIHFVFIFFFFFVKEKKKTLSNDDKGDPHSLAEHRRCGIKFLILKFTKRAYNLGEKKTESPSELGFSPRFDFSFGTRSQGAL